MITPFKFFFLIALILLTSACGYHLRGNIEVREGLNSIYLQGASAPLRKTMRKTLRSSGGQLTENIEQAGLVIQVIKEKMDRRVLSLSSTGRASEYEIIYQLEFNLLDAERKALSKAQRIEITKDYFNNQEEVLGKDNEERVIRDEMYRRAVQSIVNRSRVVLENQQR
jgi:LPS-assembly lipoprotein